MTTDTYEIYIDLRPVSDDPEPSTPPVEGPWTLSGALTSRGAPSVGSTVPISQRNQQPPPNRLRRRRTFLDKLFRWDP